MNNFRLINKSILRYFLILLTAGIFVMSGTVRSQSALDTLGSFWSPISGISNGDIKTISVDSSGFIYLSIWGSGIQRSTNGGNSWVDITNNLDFLNITAIEFDSTGKIYLGTLGGGVFVSTNNGNSWIEKNNGLSNKRVTSLKIFPGGPVYVGTIGGGVYRTKNGGNTWTQQNSGLKFWHITAMTLSDQGDVVVGTPGDGVWRSTDEAETWNRANGSITSKNITSFSKNLQGELGVGTIGGGVCLSVDGGGGWTVYHESDLCKDVTALVFSDINEPVAGLAKKGIVRYDDRIWLQWRLTSMRSSGITALARTANNTLWAAIPLMGLYKSTNKGQDWIYQNFAHNYTKLEVFGAKDGWALATKQDTSLWISSDYGVTWTGNYLEYHKITAFGLDSTGAFLVGAVSTSNPITGYLYRSVDHGQNWVTLWAKQDTTVEAIGVNTQGHIYCGLKFPPADPKDPNSVASELYLSTNNGVNWNHIAARAPAVGFEFIGINYNDDIYINKDDGLYKSDNGGASWTKVLADNVAIVSSIGFNSSSEVFCGTDLGLFKSTNDGQNWLTNDFGIDYPSVKKLIVTNNDQVIVGLSSNSGLLCSIAGGTGFYEINRGIVNTYITSLSQSRDGFIYLSTNTMYRSIEPQSLIIPTPVSPAHNAEGVDRNAVFSWQGNPKADMYEFQISDSPDFFIVGEKTTIGTTSHKLRYTLRASSRYYWRVRSRTNNAMSDWSEVMAFMSIIEAPELASPENHSGSNEVNGLEFRWHPVDSASLYKFELATDAGFSNIISSQELSDTSAVVDSLELYSKYYWRVKGRTFKADGPWSEVWDFYTKLRPPVLKAPADNSVNMPLIVLLEWYESDGATKYEVEFARDSLFTDIVFEGLTEMNTSQHTKLLEYFKTYWWRIRALNDDGQSDWSVAWKFTTTLDAPELIAPSDKSDDMPAEIVFDWEADPIVDGYHIQISRNGNFTDLVADDSTVVADSLAADSLDYFNTYYWRVRKLKNGIAGLWSEVWSFMTGLGQVKIISPENDATNQPTDMTFIWEMLKGADTYLFQLSEKNDFSSLIKQIETDKTQVEVLALDMKTKYYFRVKGQYDKGEGAWSQVHTFTTTAGMGVDYSGSNSINIDVFPNPFITKLNINFNLLNTENVRVEITDLQGNRVSTLADKRLAAGYHEFTYYPDGIAQGSYLVIVTTDNDMIVKQIVLIK